MTDTLVCANSESLCREAVLAGAAVDRKLDDLNSGSIFSFTASQLAEFSTRITVRLLDALDGMDQGCINPKDGFRGHENGYGEESAGNELQDAREELAALVGHVSRGDVELACDSASASFDSEIEN